MKACSKRVSADQASLFTSVRWPRAKMPKRAEVLANLEQLLPWAELEEIVSGVYLSDQRKTGRPGYPAKMMIRCLVLCQFWSLSDNQAEAVILDSYAMALFVGTDPWKPRPPSASAIRSFRQKLEYSKVLKRLNDTIDFSVQAAGLNVRHGVIREPVFKKPAAKSQA
jgi:Transposase domain (DUF772)